MRLEVFYPPLLKPLDSMARILTPLTSGPLDIVRWVTLISLDERVG